jgi:hypothetical protein
MNFLKGIDLGKAAGYFSAALLIIFLAVILRAFFSFQDRPGKITEKFSSILHAREKTLSIAMERMKNLSFQKGFSNRSAIERENQELYDKEGILLFVYEGDSLSYWSSNSASCPDRISSDLVKDTGYFELQKNGWYEVVIKKDNSKVYIGQILIKRQYLFENEYLKNNFKNGFRVPAGTGIENRIGPSPVYSSDGRFLFCLKIPDNPELPPLKLFVLFLLYLSGFVLFLVSIYKLYCATEQLFPSKQLFLLSLILDVLLIRLIQFYFRLPGILYDSKIFGPGSFTLSSFPWRFSGKQHRTPVSCLCVFSPLSGV